MITAAEANEILRYDPETGYLHWKARPSNCVQIGDRAGHFHKKTGYIRVGIKGIVCRAHRIIWLMYYGEFPPEQIDHINQIRHDNKIGNLRLATRQENARNTKLYLTNSSGACGVKWENPLKKWRASITVDRKQIYLGVFADWLDAVCARKAADYKYGFHINHGRD